MISSWVGFEVNVIWIIGFMTNRHLVLNYIVTMLKAKHTDFQEWDNYSINVTFWDTL